MEEHTLFIRLWRKTLWMLLAETHSYMNSRRMWNYLAKLLFLPLTKLFLF